VLPSIPYRFSDEPTELGWGPPPYRTAWAELMRRLATAGTSRRGRRGSRVTDAMGRLGLDRLIGITPTFSRRWAMPGPERVAPSTEERAALTRSPIPCDRRWVLCGQATRPETIGYAS
jgi:hypothetical protein